MKECDTMKQKFMKKPIVIEAFQTDKELIVQTFEGPEEYSLKQYKKNLKFEE